MKRVFITLALAAVFTAPAAASDDKALDAPPPGITATTTTVSQILKAYSAAVGHASDSENTTREESWSFTKSGLSGTETLVRRGTDFHAHIVTGPLSEDYGQFLGTGWHRFAGGAVSTVQSPDYGSFEMLLFMRNFDEATDPKNDVSVLGEMQAPKPAYVLQIKTAGAKHPEFAYYDKQTGLIDRFEYVADGKRAVITYDDYRPTHGLTQPWHVHWSDGTTGLDDDFARKTLAIGRSIDPKEFAIPGPAFPAVYYNGHQSLPVKIFEDPSAFDIGNNQYRVVVSPTVVVRLNVGGRGLDFAVSAAAPHSLIDFDVAQQLQLPSYGQTTHADGSAVSYDTIIPQADLGTGLLLRNWAVRATPFHYHISETTKVVGLIGYDVLSSGVFKIDYDNQALEVFPPKAFDGDHPAAATDAAVLPIRFDDGLPFFTGTIDNHDVKNILFDNDFDTSFVFGGFANAYPDSVKDLVTGKAHGSAMIPFADSKGYGKEVQVWLANVSSIKFGPAQFSNFQIIASDEDTDQVDAVMGGDLLKYYDIYLDYPHNRIFLRPNKTFFKVFQVQIVK